MNYFTDAYVQFFTDLEKNNHKEWFQANKKVYENEVKKPFQQLVADLIVELQNIDPDIKMEPKNAIFRINRDIRFSKDKTPYNTLMKAGFAKGGRKSPYAGYYLGLSAEGLHVGGGMFMLKPDELKPIRQHIANNNDVFLKLINDSKFKNAFGDVKGERIKRIPTDFVEAHEKNPYIANKQFYYMADPTDQKIISSDKLLPEIVKHFQLITPLNQFLKKALDQ